jgi:hypothetical protein
MNVWMRPRGRPEQSRYRKRRRGNGDVVVRLLRYRPHDAADEHDAAGVDEGQHRGQSSIETYAATRRSADAASNTDVTTLYRFGDAFTGRPASSRFAPF